MSGILSYSERRKIDKEYLFYFAYFFLMIKEICLKKANISDILPQTAINTMSALCSICLFGSLAVILICFERYTVKKAALYLILFGIFALSVYTCGTLSPFIALLFILCSHSIDFEKFGRFGLRLQAVILLVVSVLAATGVIGMGVRYRSDMMETARYAMGFNQPNVFALLIFQWLSLFFYLHRNDTSKKKYIIYLAIEGITYFLSDSNTFLITASLLLLFDVGIRIINKIFSISKEMKKRLGCVILAVIVIAALIAIRHWWLNPKELALSARTFMSRFTLSKKYITAYGIHWFGNHIVTGTSVAIPGFQAGYYYLDNGYVRALVEYGIFVSICAAAMVVVYLKKLIRMQDWSMIFIAICLLFYTFCEAKVVTIPFNIFLIHMGIILSNNQNQQEEIRSPLDE
jgi:hypothetical protein